MMVRYCQRLAVCLLLLGLLGVADLAGQEADIYRVDALGRPRVYGGQEGDRYRLSLTLERTRLRYGERVPAQVVCPNATSGPPYVQLNFDNRRRAFGRFAIVDAVSGEAAPLMMLQTGYGSGFNGNVIQLELVASDREAPYPTPPPGRYRVTAHLEIPPGTLRGHHWHGNMQSNTVEIEVLPPEAPPLALLPEARQKPVAAALLSLGAADPARRQKAARDLAAILDTPDGLPLLALLDTVMDAADPEPAQAARDLVTAYLQRYPPRNPPDAVLSTLGPHGLALVATLYGDKATPSLVHAALHGPISIHDATTLRQPAARQALLAAMRDPAPYARMRAVRSLPRTSDPVLHRALLDALEDDWFYWDGLDMPGDPAPTFPVRNAAYAALVWQGKAACPAILAALEASQSDPEKTRLLLVACSRIGMTPETRALFLDRLRSGDIEEQRQILSLLTGWGPDAVPILTAYAADTTHDLTLRAYAVAHSFLAVPPSESVDRLAAYLDNDEPAIRRAALEMAAYQRLPSLIPHYRAICADPDSTDTDLRCAVQGIAWALPERDAGAAMLELIHTSTRPAVRHFAIFAFRNMRDRAAIPELLDLLEDADGRVRSETDQVLKDYLDLPKGVGYQPYPRDLSTLPDEAAKWRAVIPKTPAQ